MKKFLSFLQKLAEGLSFLGDSEERDELNFTIDEWQQDDSEYLETFKAVLARHPGLMKILDDAGIELPSS